MKKLMVAGCSYSAVSLTHPGTSWSEILANRLGWELVNLSRQGCSNGGIRIQIEEIRRQRPDFAIIVPTSWDRIEIPATAAPYDWSQPLGDWAPPLETHLRNKDIKNGYNRVDGIDNVNYGNNNYNMICETIFSLAHNYPNRWRSGKISKDTQTAVKHWIDGMYDANWKQQQDEWIIMEGVVQLFSDELKFLITAGMLWLPAASPEWRKLFPKMIPDEYIWLDRMKSHQTACATHPIIGDDDPGYHGSPDSQQLIANWYYDHIITVLGQEALAG
jgi:hypothetical protein